MVNKKFVSLIIFASVVFCTIPPGISQAKPECRLVGVRLVCAKNNVSRTVFEAMANPRSLELLSNLSGKALIYSGSNQREIFRRSLEKNRRTIYTHANRALRRLKRGKMSKSAYGVVRRKFNAGIDTYWAGMAHYWAYSWFDEDG